MYVIPGLGDFQPYVDKVKNSFPSGGAFFLSDPFAIEPNDSGGSPYAGGIKEDAQKAIAAATNISPIYLFFGALLVFTLLFRR